MAISDRDFALLTEEMKCLRKKLSTMVSQSGGYTSNLTSPGSSIYPNSYYENCECAEAEFIRPDPFDICAYQEEGLFSNLGDFATDVANQRYGGIFVFDRITGVFYKPPDEENYENRNIGLTNTELEHGCVDIWWYRKTEPQPDNAILWQVGQSRILRSNNAGRIHWTNITPTAPDGETLSNIRFTQVQPDYFTQDKFLVVAETITAPWKTWIINTLDDGQNFSWVEVTNYNGIAHRSPIWLAQSGNGGGLLWLTTWADDNLTLLKLNNDPTITISAEYTLNSATRWEIENYFEIMSPCSVVDTNTVWLYGRASNPQSLGLSHVLRVENEGLDWYAVTQDWGLDWAGSMKVSLKDGSGNRNFYAVRNPRISEQEEPPEEPPTYPESSAWSSVGTFTRGSRYITDGVNLYVSHYSGGYYMTRVNVATLDTTSLPSNPFSGSTQRTGSGMACFNGEIYQTFYHTVSGEGRIYKLTSSDTVWSLVHTITYPTRASGGFSVYEDNYIFFLGEDVADATPSIFRSSDGSSWTQITTSGFTEVAGQGHYLIPINSNSLEIQSGQYHIIITDDVGGSDYDPAYYDAAVFYESHGTQVIVRHGNYYWAEISGTLRYKSVYLDAWTDTGVSYSMPTNWVNLENDVAYQVTNEGGGFYSLDIYWWTGSEWSPAERVFDTVEFGGTPSVRTIVRFNDNKVWFVVGDNVFNDRFYERDTDIV